MFPPPVVVKPVVTERPTTKADEKKVTQVKAKSKARKVEKPKALTPDQQAMKDAKATLDARDRAAADAKKAAEEAVEAAKKAGAAPETPPPAPKAGKKAK